MPVFISPMWTKGRGRGMNGDIIRSLVIVALNGIENSCRTSDEVADRLRRAGVVGRRHATCACPMAMYLTSEVRRVTPITSEEIEVTNLCIHFVSSAGGPVYFGQAVTDFVNAFDSGCYPDLIMPE